MGLFDFMKKRSTEASQCSAKNSVMSAQEAENISREFGRFLAEKLPVIKDVRLLPYPKTKILQALDISIGRCRNHTDPEDEDVTQLLNSLEGCRSGLSLFAEIEPQDREAVAYFNQFPNVGAVPEQRKAECVHLIVKYMERGLCDDHSTVKAESGTGLGSIIESRIKS